MYLGRIYSQFEINTSAH